MVACTDADIIYNGKALANHTIPDLKSILKQAGKSLGGNKPELIARMADYIRETDASNNGRSPSSVPSSSIGPDFASSSLLTSSTSSPSPLLPANLSATPDMSQESSVVSAVVASPDFDTITTPAPVVSGASSSLTSRYDEISVNYAAVIAATPINSDDLLALTKRLFDFARELHHLHVNLPSEPSKQISLESPDIITEKISNGFKEPSRKSRHAADDERVTTLNFITDMAPYYELQAMSREYGLPVNGARAAMVASLVQIFSRENLPGRTARTTPSTQCRPKSTSKVLHARPVHAKRANGDIQTPTEYYAARYAGASSSGKLDPSSFVGLAANISHVVNLGKNFTLRRNFTHPVNLAPVEKILHFGNILHFANNSPNSTALIPAINTTPHASYTAAAASKSAATASAPAANKIISHPVYKAPIAKTPHPVNNFPTPTVFYPVIDTSSVVPSPPATSHPLTTHNQSVGNSLLNNSLQVQQLLTQPDRFFPFLGQSRSLFAHVG